MFRRISQQQLLKKKVKDVASGTLNKLRILEGLPIKKLNDSQSIHSSVMSQSRHTSIKNLQNSSVASSQFSMRSSLIKSQSLEQKKIVINKEEAIEQLLQKHYGRVFTKSLVQFLNKEWTLREKQFLAQKKIKNFVQSVIQRSGWLKDLIDQFVEKQYYVLGGEDRRVMVSLLLRESIRSIKDLEGIIPDIIKKIPDQRLLKQQTTLQQLQTKLLQIYDPKCLYSNTKIKERMALYLQEFIRKKNDLKTEICMKLKTNMQLLELTEEYFSTYQKQIIKVKSQMAALENQKTRYQQLLDHKSKFTRLEVDYEKLYEMKQKTNQQIRKDLEINIVQFHQEKHKLNQKNIARLQASEVQLREDNQNLKQEIGRLNDKISDWKKNAPILRQFGVQVFMIAQGKGSQNNGGRGGSLVASFLDNVVTPFSFNRQITASLISILSIDKVLFDYESIRLRLRLQSFEQFLFEWFIIRTGCRKIAQIFIKNFLYSLKQLRTNHKRFSIFYRICGYSGYRKRNMQQDLQGIFFSSHLCWYYITKLALMYRKKLNENPNGFHFFPPLQCQDIFKLPLRKIYQLAEEFLSSEDIEIPNDLTQLIDHYCINEISKFKANDEQFQKQTLQQIHILRQINFDLVAGFLLQYIANIKCSILEKLLRTVHNKQKQENNILGYSQFQTIYRRFYKERRAKIQQIYSKLCMVNQHDVLDVENVQPVALAILEDQSPLRSSFQKLQSLKILILSQKTTLMRNQKKILHPNSYQNFKERYYHQFYDFYNTTAFLEQIFKIVKGLIKKRLRRLQKNDDDIEKLVQVKIEEQPSKQIAKRNNSDERSEQQSQSQNKQQKQDRNGQQNKLQSQNEIKDQLTAKLQQWNKIIVRVPHFASKVLTIEQIVIHNMRRKEMIDVTEFAWKTLRQILTILGKQ